MEELVFSLIGLAIIAMIVITSIRRTKKITHSCPKCGTKCNVSPWSTGLRYGDTGAYLHNFKCPICGNKFTE